MICSLHLVPWFSTYRLAGQLWPAEPFSWARKPLAPSITNSTTSLKTIRASDALGQSFAHSLLASVQVPKQNKTNFELIVLLYTNLVSNPPLKDILDRSLEWRRNLDNFGILECPVP